MTTKCFGPQVRFTRMFTSSYTDKQTQARVHAHAHPLTINPAAHLHLFGY